MYCRKCGAELRDDDAFCPKCGARVDTQPTSEQAIHQEVVENSRRGRDVGLCQIGLVFCIIGTIMWGFALIPLAWCIPMTLMVNDATKYKRPMSLALKVCVLLFVSLLGGIFLLVGDPDEQ